MPIDFSTLHLGWVGWVLIAIAAIVLFGAILRLFGHLLHLLIRGCGVVLMVVLALYVLHLLKLI